MADVDWLHALDLEDGFSLMTLLDTDPGLLNVKLRGCNVLHLAVRRRWYGLVHKILQKFQHLQEGVSSIDLTSSSALHSANPEQDTEERKPSSRADSQVEGADSLTMKGPGLLDLATFRDLLTAKEGDGIREGDDESYASGLDVFAMAVIQGHLAINSLLAEAVSNLCVFDSTHPYKNVIRLLERESLLVLPDSPPTASSKAGRETLREIVKASFGEVQLTTAGDVLTFSDAFMPVSNAHKTQTFEDEIAEIWVAQWKLMSPFLPLEEFLFLACWDTSAWTVDVDSEWSPKVAGVMRRCFDRAGDVAFITYLLAINDSGRALHHIMLYQWELSSFTSLFRLIPDGDQFGYLVNMRDSLGRTPLHIACALGLELHCQSLLKDTRTDVNALLESTALERWEWGGREWLVDVGTVSEVNGYNSSRTVMSSLHILICSPHSTELKRTKCMNLLLNREDLDLNVRCTQRLPGESSWDESTVLQLAAFLGRGPFLHLLANDDGAYDYARLNNLPHLQSALGHSRKTDLSALHLAAKYGHPHAIGIILGSGKFDPFILDPWGNTALHHATPFEFPVQLPQRLKNFYLIPRRPYKQKETLSAADERSVRLVESRRQGCINLLLQAGIDIWHANKKNQIADPGPEASPEYSAWWYEKLPKETQEVLNRLTLAANSISVTAALVATASFVGPLQPPLGYAAQAGSEINQMQVGILSVRMFIVGNTMAFYFALAAIMLSMIPSLPMPQESMLEELKRIRRTVTLAVALLILSIVSILLAFALASIAVIPDGGSWNHGGLTASTVVVGGMTCLVALILCTIRALRLVFHKNLLMRRFYQQWVFL